MVYHMFTICYFCLNHMFTSLLFRYHMFTTFLDMLMMLNSPTEKASSKRSILGEVMGLVDTSQKTPQGVKKNEPQMGEYMVIIWLIYG